MDAEIGASGAVKRRDLGHGGGLHPLGNLPIGRQDLRGVGFFIDPEIRQRIEGSRVDGRQVLDPVAKAHGLENLVEVGFLAVFPHGLPEPPELDRCRDGVAAEDLQLPGEDRRGRIHIRVWRVVLAAIKEHRHIDGLPRGQRRARKRPRRLQHEGTIQREPGERDRAVGVIGQLDGAVFLVVAGKAVLDRVLQIVEHQMVGEIRRIEAVDRQQPLADLAAAVSTACAAIAGVFAKGHGQLVDVGSGVGDGGQR